jgi:hypothetical protein
MFNGACDIQALEHDVSRCLGGGQEAGLGVPATEAGVFGAFVGRIEKNPAQHGWPQEMGTADLPGFNARLLLASTDLEGWAPSPEIGARVSA